MRSDGGCHHGVHCARLGHPIDIGAPDDPSLKKAAPVYKPLFADYRAAVDVKETPAQLWRCANDEMEMPLPDNTLPMMSGTGPFGAIEMGGMFTTMKVRKEQKPGDYSDPGWYKHPAGSLAYESK